ncbi:MAG: trehalose-6-phosphate synthase [Beijerinckiaceae bacterium]|nr:trehalose-6-phosphate synthase [Beijerinckiaceae bacterium]MDO9439583.1 trehalose-6-phosphate synthase [Beijerinckiaceae bacterium]
MGRLIAVSNRIPKPNERYSAGGLSVAVKNALERQGGLWLGWSGEVSELAEGLPKVSEVRWNNVDYVTIDLTQRDHDEYYNGFANRALWPLFHHRPGLTEFARRDMAGYYRVNQTFARTLAPMLKPDDVIWVHDYHLIPLASELRALGVKNRIGFFLHIPWPAPELLVILPNHARLAANLACYDLIGFQTKQFLDNFLAYLREEMGVETDGCGKIEAFGRVSQAGVFPISIDTEEFIRFAREPLSATNRRLEKSLEGKMLALSVDRLDYSKGIPQRIEAFGRFLELYPDYRHQFYALQIAPTTREQIPEYAEINREVAEVAGRVNGKFGDIDWAPIRYVNRSIARAALAGLYRSSRIGVVTPLRDGMNLVAKEFVAAQNEEDPGVLVLSRFAGAARELRGAIMVNPYDTDGMAHAFKAAFDMPLEERVSRIKPMIRYLKEHNVHRWCTEYLQALEGETAVTKITSVA